MAKDSRSQAQLVSHYDRLSSRYELLYKKEDHTAKFYQRRMRLFSQILDQLACKSALEIGCAVGMLSEEFLKRGILYHGVDISPGMIEQAKRKHKSNVSATFAVDNICELSISNSNHDIAVSFGALEYCKNEAAAFRELARVLAPNGYLLISGISRFSFYNIYNRNIRRPLFGQEPACIIKEFHTANDYQVLAEREGFVDLKFHYFDFYPFQYFFSSGLQNSSAIHSLTGNGFIMTARRM